MFDVGSTGCISGSITAGLRAMFRLIPVAFKLQVYQLCLCWELLPEHLCYGYCHLNDISGKRKHLLSTGHCLTFLFSLLCLLQLLGAQAT